MYSNKAWHAKVMATVRRLEGHAGAVNTGVTYKQIGVALYQAGNTLTMVQKRLAPTLLDLVDFGDLVRTGSPGAYLYHSARRMYSPSHI
jgi:hypothetical protein